MSDSTVRTEVLTLTRSEVKRLSTSHIKSVDKWNRMLNGIASDLDRYENGIIYLKIKNTEQKMATSIETAARIACTWVKFNPVLKQARGFVATFYTTQSTGFMFNAGEANDKAAVGKLVQDFVSSGERAPVLVGLFSALFVDEGLKPTPNA